MYSLIVREVCINPYLINSGSRAHLHNTTEAKGKALLWVGKAKKKQQDWWVSCQRPEEEEGGRKQQIFSTKSHLRIKAPPHVTKSVSAAEAVNSWWYHRTSRGHLVSAGSFKPKLDCHMVTAQLQNTRHLQAWSGLRQHCLCCDHLLLQKNKPKPKTTMNQTTICETI